MLSINVLLLLLAIYILVLFLIANWAQSKTPGAYRVRNSASIYALSLAVFCTSWTFYGNVALSSQTGIFPVALYLGTTVTFVFMVPLLKKMVILKNEYHSTSIADFISVRYNRSQSLAALVSLLCLVGIVPYLTIQLKSVITSFTILTPASVQQSMAFEYFDIFVVLMMAFFTIFFGVRHLDPTEKHPGMMVALAFESIFKLLAFLLGAFWICYVMNTGIEDLFSQFALKSGIEFSPPSAQSWLSYMAIGAIGIITLPRQFHVGVVECSEPKFLDRAKWLFPLYLILINLMALPVALAGFNKPELLQQADLLLLTLPLSDNASLVSALVFLGGFAAATGMIMISAMTLSTMLSNHLIVPLFIRLGLTGLIKAFLLQVRWLVVLFILFLSLFYYRAIGDSELIVRIGTISFVASIQFAPALIGGMVWKDANIKGALAGLSAGAVIWAYCSLLPSFIRSGWLEWDILEQQSGFFYWFNPEHLFAIQNTSTLTNSLSWSLLANIILYVGVSLLSKTSDEEYKIAHQFVEIKTQDIPNLQKQEKRNIALAPKVNTIYRLFSQYMPNASIDEKINTCVAKAGLSSQEHITISELSELKNNAVNALAGIIGMASAYHAFLRINLINIGEQEQLEKSFSKFFSQLQLSPHELFEQVSFHQEKRELLENHAQQQLHTIKQLQEEIAQRVKADEALNLLNQELEARVEQRTQALSESNLELTTALEELKQAQKKLLETDKMAALGGLVAGVAHEINTPVGVVLTAISYMNEKCRNIVDKLDHHTLTAKQLHQFTDELEKGFELALANIERAVRQIESFKKVAVDSTVDEARSFNLYYYLQDILLSLKPKYKHYDLDIELDCPKNIQIVNYPGAIAQIISNLIINSLMHGLEPERHGKILIKATQLVDKIELIYTDDGKGLTEEGKAHIFEPFYTTKRGAGGSGLGAHIIYNLVNQRLKGEIELLSDQKQGVGYKMTFPCNTSTVKTDFQI